MKIAIFTGPRVISADDEKIVQSVTREVVARGYRIYVGDAAGVDKTVFHTAKEEFLKQGDYGWFATHCEVFHPKNKPGLSHTPAGLAERSTRMVKEALRDAYKHTCSNCGEKIFGSPGSVPSAIICRCGNTKDWPRHEVIAIGFPNKPCPDGIVPARSWKSGNTEGSGTWSTIALAVGHNIEAWIFQLGEGHAAPYWCSKIEAFDTNTGYKISGFTIPKIFFGRHFTPAQSLFEVQS